MSAMRAALSTGNSGERSANFSAALGEVHFGDFPVMQGRIDVIWAASEHFSG